MLNIVSSNQFKRDLKLAQKRGFDMGKLRTVVNTLANEQPLAEKYKDRYIVIDASGEKAETHKKIVDALKEKGVL